MDTNREDIKRAEALLDPNQTREVPGAYDQAEREADQAEHERVMAASRAEERESERMIEVTVYKDTTGLYTQEEIDENNLTDLLFPESIVSEFATKNEFQSLDDFMQNYTADNTVGLVDFAKERGFDLFDLDYQEAMRETDDREVTYKDYEAGELDAYAEADLDAYEAEFGADGRRAFPHLNDEPRTYPEIEVEVSPHYLVPEFKATTYSVAEFNDILTMVNDRWQSDESTEGKHAGIQVEVHLGDAESYKISISVETNLPTLSEHLAYNDFVGLHENIVNAVKEAENEVVRHKSIPELTGTEYIVQLSDELQDRLRSAISKIDGADVETAMAGRLNDLEDNLDWYKELNKLELASRIGRLETDVIIGGLSAGGAPEFPFTRDQILDALDSGNTEALETAINDMKGYVSLQNEEKRLNVLDSIREYSAVTTQKIELSENEEKIMFGSPAEAEKAMKIADLADRIDDLANEMYNRFDENVPLISFTKDDVIKALNSGKVEDITTALVNMRGYVNEDLRLEAFSSVREYSDKPIMLLTGKEISDEFQSTLSQLESGKYVSLEDIMKLPEIKMAESRRVANFVDTSKLPGRRELRKQAARALSEFGSATIDKDGKVSYTGEVEKGSRLDIVVGLPASGKSSALVDVISQEFHSKVLDNDEAKKMFREFNHGWGAGSVHKESQKVELGAFHDALKKKENIVLPKVGGDADKLLKTYIAAAKKRGYTVNIHYVDLDREKSLGRMLQRFINAGRYLEPKLIDDYNNAIDGNRVEQTYEKFKNDPEYAKHIDGFSKWDNDVEKGEKPILIETQNLSGQFIENARTQAKGEQEHGRTENDTGERSNGERSADNITADNGDYGGSRRGNDASVNEIAGNGHRQSLNRRDNRSDFRGGVENRTLTLSVGESPEKIAAEIENFADAKGSFFVSFENDRNEVVSEFYVLDMNLKDRQENPSIPMAVDIYNEGVEKHGITHSEAAKEMSDYVKASIDKTKETITPGLSAEEIEKRTTFKALDTEKDGVGRIGGISIPAPPDKPIVVPQKEPDKATPNDKLVVSLNPKWVGDPFKAKDGNFYVRIKIPNEDKADKSPWRSLVVKPDQITKNEVTGKTDVALNAKGSVTIYKSKLVGYDQSNRPEFINDKTKITNVELKAQIARLEPKNIKSLIVTKNKQKEMNQSNAPQKDNQLDQTAKKKNNIDGRD